LKIGSCIWLAMKSTESRRPSSSRSLSITSSRRTNTRVRRGRSSAPRLQRKFLQRRT
jgi:hypothetical protein